MIDALERFEAADRRRHLRRLALRLERQTFARWEVKSIRRSGVEVRRDGRLLFAGDCMSAEEILLEAMRCDCAVERFKRVEGLARRLTKGSTRTWRTRIISPGRIQLICDGEAKYAGDSWSIESYLLGGLSMAHELKAERSAGAEQPPNRPARGGPAWRESMRAALDKPDAPAGHGGER